MRQPFCSQNPVAPFQVRLSDGTVRTYTSWGVNPAEPPPFDPRRGLVRDLEGSMEFGPRPEAEIIVGLRVGGEPLERWTPENIRDGVKEVRTQLVREAAEAHGEDPAKAEVGATLIPTLRFWGVSTESGQPQRSVSVRVIALGTETSVEFAENMKELGYRLAEKFLQQVVIVRILYGGLVQRVYACKTRDEPKAQ